MSLAAAPVASSSAPSHRIVLVTGGSGLVGSAIRSIVDDEQRNASSSQSSSSSSADQFIFLSSSDGDLRDPAACRALFVLHRPTHVLHLAAFVGGLYSNMRQPVEFWKYNIAMNENIIQLSHEFNVTKLVSCLSTCIFPDKTTFPIDETMIHDGPPHHSNEAYAYAKRMIDVQNRAYNRQYGCCFTSVVPTNVYGPHDNYHIGDSHVIPGLIHKVYIAKRDGTPLTVWGSGRPLRQFIYARDLAALFLWTMRAYDDPSPIILSVDPEDEVTIRRVVELIVDAMKFEGDVVYDESKADGQYKKTASNAKLRKLHPKFEFTNIESGIKETVQWFVDNYQTARK